MVNAQCPACRTGLRHVTGRDFNYWDCASCGGRAVSVALVRRSVDRQYMAEVWQQAAQGPAVASRACPMCRRGMRRGVAGIVELDVCTPCQFLWATPEMLAALPKPPVAVDPQRTIRELPMEARVAVARAQVSAIEDRASIGMGARPPDEGWKVLAAVFGLPVEYSQESFTRQPLVTWGLVLLCMITALLSGLGGDAAKAWGFLPSDMFRHGGLTLLTGALLHGSIGHLAGNMYFLFVFGDNVEDYLGKTRYLMLLAFAIIAGDLLHGLFDPRSEVPLVGASAAISGVIAFYGLHLPQARLGIMFFFRWVTFPAWVALIWWLVLQVFGVMKQTGGVSAVSALAHVGGGLVGAAMWFLFRQRQQVPQGFTAKRK